MVAVVTPVLWSIVDVAYLCIGGCVAGFLVASKRVVSFQESPIALFIIPAWPLAVFYHAGSVIGAHYAPSARVDELTAEVARLRAELSERGGFR